MQTPEKRSSSSSSNEKNKEKIGDKAWEFIFKFHHLVGLFLVAVLAAALYISPAIDWNVVRVQFAFEQEKTALPTNSVSRCNLFSGTWVYDNESYPLYKEEQCSFTEGFACQKYGRKDSKYQHWRWQPHQCELPRFDGKALLEKIRGKRLVYVGDTLMKNQWKSMLCLIESSLPPSSDKSLNLKGNNSYIFHSTEYDAKIEFYWSPFLVESNCDDMASQRGVEPIVKIKSIEKHAREWNDADILVFNSFIWWMQPTITILWGAFGSPNATYKTVNKSLRPYEIALRSWSNWLEINVDRKKTKLYFMSNSPIHHGGEVWCEEQRCYRETEPISVEGQWGCGSNPGLRGIPESALDKLLSGGGLKVQYLNVTQLSGYRKDAHLSVHNYKMFNDHMSTEDQLKKNLETNSDCINWCLPGVPDVWNELFYAYIMNPDKYY